MSKIIFDEIGTSNIPKTSLDISLVPIIHTGDLVAKLETILNLILENLPEEKTIVNVFKSPTDMRNIYNEINAKLGLEVEEIEDQTLDIYAIEGLDNKTRNQIEYFTRKIQGNAIAKEFLEYWIEEIFDPNEHFIEYKSNVHVFKKGDQKDFLFRMAYYTNFIVSFEFYGLKYRSYLYDNPNFTKWAKENLDEKGRLYLNSSEEVRKLKDILQVVLVD